MIRAIACRPSRALLASILLAACGGGGGSGAGGGGGGGRPTLTVDVPSFTFRGLQGVPVPVKRFNLTLSGGTGTYHPAIRASPAGLWEYTWSPTSTTAWIDVRPAAAINPSTMPTGTQTGTIKMLACNDAACTSVATEATIALTVDIAAVPKTPIALSASEGLTGAPFDLAVTPPEAGATVNVSADAAGSSTTSVPWLSIDRSDPAVVRTSGAGAGLAPGSYAGELHVTRPGMTGEVVVPVTLGVQPGTIAPAPASLVVDRATQPSALSGTLDVAFQPGLAPAWTASSDQSWLHVTAPQAPGAGALAYEVDAAGLAALPNWASTTAHVTIQPTGLAAAATAVTVQLQLPEIAFARTPLLAGQATDVRLYGRGLSQLASAADLAVEGLSGVTGTIDSEREARLTAVSLTAGRHVVSASNALGIPTRTAPIDVYASGTLPAGAVDHTGYVRGVAFDLARAQILVAKAGKLVRLRLVDGAWQVDETAIANLSEVALALDGGTVYAVTDLGTYEHGTLHLLDPSTLAVESSHTTTGTTWSIGYTAPALTADGRVWFPGTGPVYFDPGTATFVEYRPPPTEYLDFYSARVAASADGTRLLATPSSAGWNAGSTADGRPWLYTLAADRFAYQAGAPIYFWEFALSADGARVLEYNYWLYDTATWTALGHASIPNTSTGTAHALSPDGRRVYRTVQIANDGTVARIDVLDAGAVVPGTTNLVKLGEIPVGVKVCDGSPGAYYDCNQDTTLAVSPLGDALFLGGGRKLMVVPVPATLSGVGGP